MTVLTRVGDRSFLLDDFDVCTNTYVTFFPVAQLIKVTKSTIARDGICNTHMVYYTTPWMAKHAFRLFAVFLESLPLNLLDLFLGICLCNIRV